MSNTNSSSDSNKDKSINEISQKENKYCLISLPLFILSIIIAAILITWFLIFDWCYCSGYEKPENYDYNISYNYEYVCDDGCTTNSCCHSNRSFPIEKNANDVVITIEEGRFFIKITKTICMSILLLASIYILYKLISDQLKRSNEKDNKQNKIVNSLLNHLLYNNAFNCCCRCQNSQVNTSNKKTESEKGNVTNVEIEKNIKVYVNLVDGDEKSYTTNGGNKKPDDDKSNSTTAETRESGNDKSNSTTAETRESGDNKPNSSIGESKKTDAEKTND